MGLIPTPSTTETHGPFRRVVEVRDVPASAHAARRAQIRQINRKAR